ncbi:MAG: sialidase family protein [Planctomycetota bacterium]
MCRKSILTGAVLVLSLVVITSSFAQSCHGSKSSMLEHALVFSEPDKFAAWPANNGVWSWGDEILVGFTYGGYKVKDSHDIEKPQFNVLGRSTDGGRTWKIKDPENFSGDDAEAKPSPGGINFAHPDFAMRVGGKEFFISYDRGRSWQGPYLFGEFGLPKSELTEITSRTDYIVNGPQDCFIFTSVRKPGKFGTDRAFGMRTTDGGKTFKFVSWIVPLEDPHRGVMPSTVRLTDDKLVTAIRRRAYPQDECWVDAYSSNDNGNSWKFLSRVGETGNWNGNPPALARLKDGRLCCVYGNRTERRIYAAISNDEGATWSERITLRDDFRKDTEQDLGYPRLVQRADGALVTMYYWATDERPQQHIAATIIDTAKSVVPVKSAKHVVVHGGPEIFCAWPANNGLWSWGSEIAVGFAERKFAEKEGHNYASRDSTRSLLARSMDSGETWKIEDPHNFVGDGGETTGPPGGMNFGHPDFAMRIKKEPEQFWYSHDRGHTWKGPYNFGELMKHPKLNGKEFTARTDYIVNGPDDCLVFLSAKRGESGSDFTFTARTTNGGKSFDFVSWIVPPTDPHRGVMPTTARCSDKKLVTAIRRRQGGGKPCWIDVYVSNDNGSSWSFLSKVGDAGVWNGNPPALVRMKDGRLCCVYGNRSRKQMIARFSGDEGATWGPEVILRDDFQVDSFDDRDFGYPRLVQRPDGKLVAIYYWATKEHPQHYIAATVWKQEQ